MEDKQLHRAILRVIQVLKSSVAVLALLLTVVLFLFGKYFDLPDFEETISLADSEPMEVMDGIHIKTGLIDAPGLALVIQHCTSCHSSKLITQNRMTSAGWTSTIRWMQETQNLWDLKGDEEQVVAYLAKNYAPEKKGRRPNLVEIEWYELE